MVNIKILLENGLKVGDKIHKDCELKELNAREVYEINADAEEIRIIGKDTIIIQSPSKVAMATLRKQIAKLGDLTMPLSEEEFGSLSNTDLEIIQEASKQLNKALREKVSKRFEKAEAESMVARGRDNLGVSEAGLPD